MPKVSVGLPVYNGERYLAESIESILAQSHGDLELVIGDNGSTDATEETCRRYARLDRRVRYHRHPQNLGASYNFNAVFHLSSGEYFRWQACDDVSLPDFIRCCLEVMEREGVALAYPRWALIDAEGRLLPNEDREPTWRGGPPHRRLEDLLFDRPRSLLHRCIPIYGLMRRRQLAQTGLLRPFVSSDEVLIVEMALKGDLAQVPEVLFYRRWHEANLMKAHTTAEARIAWFDPKKGRSFPMPRTRRAAELAARVLRAPVSLGEKLRCLRVEARWLSRREWRVIGGECKIKLREWGSRVFFTLSMRHKLQHPD
jgi:glycosyltransferase involved in cell wall biosynthesis